MNIYELLLFKKIAAIPGKGIRGKIKGQKEIKVTFDGSDSKMKILWDAIREAGYNPV